MKFKIGYFLASAFVGAMLATGCTEDIDTSNRYTFTGQTCTDYIASKPEFSEYYKLLCATKISSQSNSTMAQLLSTRGLYSVFPPTNEAISKYLERNAAEKIIPEGIGNFDQLREVDAHVADSLQDIIVRNSIIDRSRTGNSFWYINDMVNQTLTARELQAANMNNRYLVVEDSGLHTVQIGDQMIEKQFYYVQHAPVRNIDIEVFNGVIQEMDGVVAPTNDNVFDVLLGDGKNYNIISGLMQLTGWDKLLSDPELGYADRTYNELYLASGGDLSPNAKQDADGRWYQISPSGGGSTPSYFPERRDMGFTVFAETDDVFKKLGITGTDEQSIAKLMDYLSTQMTGAVVDNNFKDSTNILNQFVSYHILPFRAAYDQLVVHYNELGHSAINSTRPGMMVSEYYETAGWPRRLMKFSHGVSTNGMRINRISKLHRSKPDNEINIEAEGVLVRENGDSIYSTIDTPANGFVYPITELLVYSDKFRSALGRERIRFDVTAAMPEMISNKQRRPIDNGEYVSYPNSYPYLSRMWVNEQSVVCYLPGTNFGWANAQGDEFNINGQYEVTIQLPPVPVSQTYEIRYGVSASGRRGMCQVYFGDNRHAMPAAGIPLDLRLTAVNYGWVEDTKDDEATNNEVDKKLRNNTFMKAPATYMARGFTSSYAYMNNANVLRNNSDYAGAGAIIRRIVVRQHMDASKTYYIKFKNVLVDPKTEFFFDYLELCPKNVYDNPSIPEDIW